MFYLLKNEPMKTIAAIAIISITALSVQAQEATPDRRNGNNDLKLNVFYGVLEALELEYERILNDNVGVGLAANYWFDDNTEFKFMALPYFRFYPSEVLHGAGFFIEANLAVVGMEEYTWQPYNYGYDENPTVNVNMGAGVAAGGKFVSKSGFFGEVTAGIGRVFNDESYAEYYPRLGISFGKRFGR
jgi:hypothetical protein